MMGLQNCCEKIFKTSRRNSENFLKDLKEEQHKTVMKSVEEGAGDISESAGLHEEQGVIRGWRVGTVPRGSNWIIESVVTCGRWAKGRFRAKQLREAIWEIFKSGVGWTSVSELMTSNCSQCGDNRVKRDKSKSAQGR
jgi:predicted  nucleic acid-binding Zn-ribbon protein